MSDGGKRRPDLALIAFAIAAAMLPLAAALVAGYVAREPIGRAVDVARRLPEILGNPLVTEIVHDTPPGFRVVRGVADPGFLLLSAYLVDEDRIGIRLIDLSDGSVAHAWYPDPLEIRRRSDYAEFSDPDRFQPESPVLMPDGGLVFIDNQGPLVRIDACSQIEWITDGQFHHSLERDLDGNLIAPVVMRPRYEDELLPAPYLDHGYAVVTPDGEIIDTRSITRIMLKAGLIGLMHTSYPREFDFTHLNDAEVADEDAGIWKRGDLLLSLRNLNLIMIYRPGTDNVVWSQVGPWLKQHDPDFQPDGTITVFSNDVIDLEDKAFLHGHSSVYAVDPVKGVTEQRFASIMAAENVGTVTQGLIELLPNGDLFVEETDVGRLMRLAEDGVVWSYYNRDAERAGVLFWSRFLSEAEVAAAHIPSNCP